MGIAGTPFERLVLENNQTFGHPSDVFSNTNYPTLAVAFDCGTCLFSSYLEWLDGRDPKEFNPRRYYGEVYDDFMAGPSDEVSSLSQGLPAKAEISAEELLKE